MKYCGRKSLRQGTADFPFTYIELNPPNNELVRRILLFALKTIKSVFFLDKNIMEIYNNKVYIFPLEVSFVY